MASPSTPMFVRDLMTRRVGSVDTSATLEHVRQIAFRDDLVAVAVMHRRRAVAALTRQRLEEIHLGGVPEDTSAWFERVDGRPPLLLAPDDLTVDLPVLFAQSGATVALVVDHDDIVGLVTLSQLS